MLKQWNIRRKSNSQLKNCKNSALKQHNEKFLGLLNLPITQVPLLALDLEMTGLDPHSAQIISIGIVPILDGKILLTQAEHKLLKINGSVGQSATIHGLLDKHLQEALSIEQALQWLVKKATGKIIIAHHAPLDFSFIEQAILTHLHEKYKFYAIDTLAIERKRLLRNQEVIKNGELRLAACRDRYSLPVYNAHNALIDAVACGELLLAQLADMTGDEDINLVDLIT